MTCTRGLCCTLLLLLVGCNETPPPSARPSKPSGFAYVYDGVQFVTPTEEYVERIELVGDNIELKDVQLILPDGFAIDPQAVTLELLKMHGVGIGSEWKDVDGTLCILTDTYD